MRKNNLKFDQRHDHQPELSLVPPEQLPTPLWPQEVHPAIPDHPPIPEQATVSVKTKYRFALVCAALWACISFFAAGQWLRDLTQLLGKFSANLIVLGIVTIPGFINAFLVSSLLMDRRPKRRPLASLPGLTILVAAYNEEQSILGTIESIAAQDYAAPLDVIVISDGSTDRTMEILRTLSYPWLRVVDLKKNGGKANALNAGLKLARHDLTITLDGDSFLHKDALVNLVERYVNGPRDTAAVAGAVLVRNSRNNLISGVQEWDYFHGIAAVKRVQSLYEGTLVAQGAFSLYRTDVLREIGGWPDLVGEDIVLTWAILEKGYRVGYCEDACSFTNAPASFGQFIRQRQRWARGLIEALKCHWRLLFQRRMSTIFIWFNLMLPYMDVVFTATFIPGLVLALCGYYWLAGPMTLLVLPLTLLVNYLMFSIQRKMFVTQGLAVRRNRMGFAAYALLYGAVLQPACVMGYCKEVLNMPKKWGTK
ncbi:MAG: glycosyltransferase family 2 protein [Massilia sp.]